MIKNHFLRELSISSTCSRGTVNKKSDVFNIQSWLNLHALRDPAAGTATGIDGVFGPATEKAVINFQNSMGLTPTGIVDQQLFGVLSRPISDAFNYNPPGRGLREKIIQIAHIHLQSRPYELIINKRNNSGPWVRSYMDGLDGEYMLWCMGFVQTIIDQAASAENKDFRALMPRTYDCDVIAKIGQDKRLLIKNKDIRRDPALVKPGDIFLIPRNSFDWYHTGLIESVNDGFFETIEGNTNNDGSSNGNGVYKRTRNFKDRLVDVFSIEPLV